MMGNRYGLHVQEKNILTPRAQTTDKLSESFEPFQVRQ